MGESPFEIGEDKDGRLGVVQPSGRLRDLTEYSVNPAFWGDLMAAVEKYERKHKLVQPVEKHIIRLGEMELTDPRYYSSRTVAKIIRETRRIINTDQGVPTGRKLSRMVGVARAVRKLMPYDRRTKGRRADRIEELTVIDRQLSLATVCRHHAPATVAALVKMGETDGRFQDTVLVAHWYRGGGDGHALAFVPSRERFVDGTKGRSFSIEEYLNLHKPCDFSYGYYPGMVNARGKKTMQFRSFDPRNPETYPKS